MREGRRGFPRLAVENVSRTRIRRQRHAADSPPRFVSTGSLMTSFFYANVVFGLGLLGYGAARVSVALLRKGGLSFPETLVSVLVFVVFVALGAVASIYLFPWVTGRWEFVIDRAAGTLSERFGLRLVPFLPLTPVLLREWRLAGFERVRLSSNHPPVSQRLCLSGPDGDLLMARALREREARALAEDVAASAGLPLLDETGWDPVEREPDRLDEPLGERIRRIGPTLPAPTFPPELPGSYEVGEEETRIEIHGRYRGWPFVIAFVIASALTWSVVRAWPARAPVRPAVPVFAEAPAEPTSAPSLWPWRLHQVIYYFPRAVGLVLALASVGMGAGALQEVKNKEPSWTVRAARDGLRVRRRRFLLGRSWLIPWDELEELRHERRPRPHLVAISDRSVVRFAHGASDEEIGWIRHRLVERLAAVR